MTRMLKYVPIIGDKYNDWTVISDQVFNKKTNNSTYWSVRCKCGFESIIPANHLAEGHCRCCRDCMKITDYGDTFTLSYLNRIKKRAIKINVDYNLDNDYLYSMYINQDRKCNLSGLDIQFRKHWRNPRTQTASLDRIDNKLGYTKGNVQWVHKNINFMKGLLMQDEFIDMCKLVVTKNAEDLNEGYSKCG